MSTCSKMAQYFASIRSSAKALAAFFEAFPIGGDIHHHALGALLPEAIWAKGGRFWANAEGQLSASAQPGFLPLYSYNKSEMLANWSIKGASKEGHAQQFFNFFAKIAPIFQGQEGYWLGQIAQQAAAENILYVETLIEAPAARQELWSWTQGWSSQPANFERWTQSLINYGIEDLTQEVLAEIAGWQADYQALAGPKAQLGLQWYAVRTYPLPMVFAQLYLAFQLAQQSDWVLGVNLVGPEHAELSQAEFEGQMQALRYLKQLFPKVSLALHAGELRSDILAGRPYQNPIEQAIQLGAQRIGHGVGLPLESNAAACLQMMKERAIPLELLLTSNAFILGLPAEQHPFSTYLAAEVSIVLASDDPALLATSLSQEYCLLAQNSELSYEDFKQLSFNSIRYSFLSEKEKENLEQELKKAFLSFEDRKINPINH